jgi:ketosteroid isomerase-like protein
MTTAFIDNHATEAAFYNAFRQLDIELMRALWIDGASAACVHPGGDLLQGKEAVMGSWAEIFHAAQPPDVAFTLLSVDLRDDLAVHLVREHVSSADGQHASVIATNVYRRTGSGWHMQLHHASLPLVDTAKARTPSRPLH